MKNRQSAYVNMVRRGDQEAVVCAWDPESAHDQLRRVEWNGQHRELELLSSRIDTNERELARPTHEDAALTTRDRWENTRTKTNTSNYRDE